MRRDYEQTRELKLIYEIDSHAFPFTCTIEHKFYETFWIDFEIIMPETYITDFSHHSKRLVHGFFTYDVEKNILHLTSLDNYSSPFQADLVYADISYIGEEEIQLFKGAGLSAMCNSISFIKNVFRLKEQTAVKLNPANPRVGQYYYEQLGFEYDKTEIIPTMKTYLSTLINKCSNQKVNKFLKRIRTI